MFFLAKELGMTLAQLAKHLTQEELVGWAAFYEMKAKRKNELWIVPACLKGRELWLRVKLTQAPLRFARGQLRRRY